MITYVFDKPISDKTRKLMGVISQLYHSGDEDDDFRNLKLLLGQLNPIEEISVKSICRVFGEAENRTVQFYPLADESDGKDRIRIEIVESAPSETA